MFCSHFSAGKSYTHVCTRWERTRRPRAAIRYVGDFSFPGFNRNGVLALRTRRRRLVTIDIIVATLFRTTDLTFTSIKRTAADVRPAERNNAPERARYKGVPISSIKCEFSLGPRLARTTVTCRLHTHEVA